MNNYVLRKYRKFYEQRGYIPQLFNPYNAVEITDIAPTLTTNCANISSSSAVLIIERRGEQDGC